MSNIFNALKQAGDETAAIALSAIGDGTVESGDAPSPRPAAPLPPAAPPGPAPVPHLRSLHVSLNANHPVLPFDHGTSYAAEQYRILRTRILQHPMRPRMLVVSSAAPGDGKTITAINLAGSLALKHEGSVLLVDADLRRPALNENLGLPASPGLQQVLEGKASLEQAMIAIADFRELYCLGAGERRVNPAELLDSTRWSELCSRLREMFTYIVIDSPPIGALADYDLIQATADGVIIVVRPDHTDRKLCLNALRTVPESKLLGVLLNCVPEWFLGNLGAGYPNYQH